jgi:Secretion system C-terminal sorting domain/Bacterial pre-peptidase C-terminal domain
VALTSASILYKVDNGTESTFAWTGSLASGATASVTLPSVTGYAAGNHTFTARAASPNGGVDGNAANDATTSNFSYSSCSNSNEPTDNSSSTPTTLAVNTAVNSQIGSATDVDYYKFTTTTVAPKIKIALTNLPADYEMTLYRSKANGTIGTAITSSTNSGTVSEAITYNTATSGATYYIKVFGYSGANSTTGCYNLALNTSSTNFIRPFEGNAKGDKIVSEIAVLKLYPNPASEAFTIQYNAVEAGEYDVKVYDILGKEMVSLKKEFALGQNAYEVKSTELPKGIYLVKVSNEAQSDVNKLIIEK